MKIQASPRRERKIRAAAADRVIDEALQMVREQVQAQISTRRAHPPRWDREPAALALTGPRKTDDTREAILRRWGLPTVLHDLDAMCLLPEGGWHVITLPPRVELYSWALKASTHPCGQPYLAALATVGIFSTFTLSEAAGFVVDCMNLDPVRKSSPRSSANVWIPIAITLVNVWQARQERFESRNVGDVGSLVESIAAIRDSAATKQIEQMERDLADFRRNPGFRRPRIVRGEAVAS